MKETDLRELQLMELKIAKEVKRVCEELNIRYFLMAGSLLGAVRHKGFIPWDDDMDIGMLREDYERFLKYAVSIIGDEFYLQNWDIDPSYPFSFAKVRLNGTTVVEKMNMGVETHKGVFLDVFPFDNVPNRKCNRIRQAAWTYLLKKMLWIKKGYGKELKKQGLKLWLKYTVGRILSSCTTYEKLKRKYYSELTKYNGENSKYVFCSCLYSYKKSCVRREYVENLGQYMFEDDFFNGPADYDGYLSHLYGHYMELPPEEKRHTHEIQEFSINATGE